MNIGEIAEAFIRAARVDLHSIGPVGPSPVRSLSLPYVHDQADKNGWGTERLAEDRKEFWLRLSNQPTAAEISEADLTKVWLASVPDASQRQCLMAWANAQIGGETFTSWCFRQGFHPMTGTRRKDRALEHISRSLGGRTIQHCEKGREGVLPQAPEMSDVHATIEAARQKDGEVQSWMAEDAFARVLAPENDDFSWAARRNEMRRQREAKRKRAA